MLKSKSQLTCSYCSKILKDPIYLPCGDSICRNHLSERRVVKENRIECNKCKRDFEVKDNQFKSNKTFNMFVEYVYHLSEKEKSLKQSLKVGSVGSRIL